MFFLPAEQLWIGEDLLQSVVVADAKGEDRLSWVAGKMPGYARREGQHHLPCDFNSTPGTGVKRQLPEFFYGPNLDANL